MIKIVLIGAGSFVFGPSVLSQAILEHQLPDLHIVMVDTDPDAARLMAAVGQRMASVTGVRATITSTTDRAAALPDANYVINSAARQLWSRFAQDVDIAHQFDPTHVITEFSGIAGISYSLRQIALLEEIAADIRQHCPKATLLNVANPLPRVCQAAHELGIRTVGFCSATQDTYQTLWTLFTGERESYPWPKASAAWNLVMGGTNHFTWLVAFIDRQSRADLLPQLRTRLASASLGHPVADRIYKQTGTLLFPNDNHTKDFLPPSPGIAPRTHPGHGSAEERATRLALLADIAAGNTPWTVLTAHPSWERTVDLIAGLSYNKSIDFHALNLINADAHIPQLPKNVFVETPAAIHHGILTPRPINLPTPVLPYATSAAAVTNAITQAALARSKKLLHEAIALDPTILNKPLAQSALEACLVAHADILPQYS